MTPLPEQSISIDAATLMGRLTEIAEAFEALRPPVYNAVVDKRPLGVHEAKKVLAAQERGHALTVALSTDLRAAMRLAGDGRVGSRS